MNINQYNNNWLQETQIVDISNSIIYTTSNRFQKSFFQNYVDVSGSLIVRNGFIYNNYLSNYLSYHDQYIVSLSGTINPIKPYIFDSYNFISISGVTISSFIMSTINYHTSQLVTISSYLISNNYKIAYYDLYIKSLSGNLKAQLDLNNYQITQINSLSGFINLFTPYLLDSSYYNSYTISAGVGLSGFITLSSYVYQPSLINYHTNVLNTLSSNLYNLKFPNNDLYLTSLSSTLINYIVSNNQLVNSLSGYINLYKPYLIDNAYYNFVTLSSTISGAAVYTTISSYIFNQSLINYHSNVLNSISSNLYSNYANKNTYNKFNDVTDFYASINLYRGQYMGFNDYTATYGTYLGQNAANFEITNYGSNIVVTTPVFDLTNCYSYFKGGTNSLGTNYGSHLPYNGDGKNYITGETNLRGGNVNINDGLLTAYNGLTVYGSLSLPNNSINDAALSANIATINYVNNYFLTLSSNIYNFKAPNYDLQILTISNTLLYQSNINIIQASQINTISSYINSLKIPNYDLQILTLSSSLYNQININGYQISQINSISSYIVTINNKLSYHDLYLNSLSGSIPKLNTSNIFAGTNTFTTVNTDGITLSLNSNINQSGSGKLLQTSSTAINTMSKIQLNSNSDLVFSSGTGIIDQLNGGSGATLGPLTMRANAKISFSAGNGSIDQLGSTGLNRFVQSTFLGNIDFTNASTITNAGNVLILPTTISGTIATLNNLSSYVLNSSLSTSLSNYLTTSSASSTYQTIAGMSSYLTSASSISDSQLSSNISKLNVNNTYTGTNQYNNDLVVYTTTNYLRLSDGTASTRFSQNLGDCLVTNMKMFSGGFGDIVLSTTDTIGGTNERVRISYNKIKTSVNIELPTSFTTPTSGQLGYIEPITYKNITTFNLVSGTNYNIASITLNPGSYIITGQGGAQLTGASSVTAIITQLSISSTSATIDNASYIIEMNNTSNNTNNIKHLTRIVSITSQTIFYLVLNNIYGAYTVSYNSNSYAFTSLTAMRIG